MSLIRTLCALCLAISIAAFPIAAPQAHAHAGHLTATPISIGAAGHWHATAAHHHHEVTTGIRVHADDPGKQPQDDQASSCCGTIACHAFLASAAPDLQVGRVFVRVGLRLAEEQTEGRFLSRLDRPPRTA